MSLTAYPYIVYNWITVFSVTGVIICIFLGIKQKLLPKNLPREISTIEFDEKMSSLSTELNTILFIYCIMIFANIVQVVFFLLGIATFYWLAMLIKKIFTVIFKSHFSDFIAPPQILFIYDCFECGDQIIVKWLRKQLDLFVSILIISFLVIGFIIITVFFSFHLYQENSQLAENIWDQRKVILPKIDFFTDLVSKSNTTVDFDDLFNATSALIMTHGKEFIQTKMAGKSFHFC